MLIALDGIKAPISLHHCDEIVGPLAMVLGSWRFRVLENTAGRGTAAAISVRRGSRSYRISSPWLDEPVVEQSEVGAVFSVAAELARAFAEERPGLLCLHCAAVETGGRLILFPNRENAGKSTLATGLAAAGFRLFADDVLAVSEVSQQGISLGIAPRLRLPLPRSCGASFHGFVESHRGPRDTEFLYLNLNASQLAPHGQTCPIGATVLLDRRRSAAPKLTALARGRVLRQLIVQNFAPGGTSLTTINRLFSMIETAGCFLFTYSKLDQAIDFLSKRFSSGEASWREDRIDQVRGTGVCEIEVEVAQHHRPRPAQFTQMAGVALRAIDNDIFLVKSGDAAVFHLNAMAASLWHMLERPTSLASAIDAVQKAFPAADGGKVQRDVRNVFDALRKAGLIRPWDRSGASHS
jgi:hypothetical protein